MFFVQNPCGSRRTGTNYLKHLILENLSVTTGNFVFKHCFPSDPGNMNKIISILEQDVKSIYGNKRNIHVNTDKILGFPISIRNPYTWMVSRKKWQENIRKGRILSTKELCERYNKRYKAWHDLSLKYSAQIVIVKYEDVLNDFDKILTWISNTLDIQRKRTPFVDITRKVGPGKGNQKLATGNPRDSKTRTVRYRLKLLSKQEIRDISSTIDFDFFNQYGYKRVK